MPRIRTKRAFNSFILILIHPICRQSAYQVEQCIAISIVLDHHLHKITFSNSLNVLICIIYYNFIILMYIISYLHFSWHTTLLLLLRTPFSIYLTCLNLLNT